MTRKPPEKPAPTSRQQRANALVEAGRRAEDARARKARALLEAIRGQMADVAESFLELGASLKALYDGALHTPLGYDSFEALLSGERLVSRSQAFKLMAVASVFAKADIRDFGIERAMALIAYTRATPEEDDAAELLRANAEVGGVEVRSATIDDLQRARREVLMAQAGAAPASAEAVARARAQKTAIQTIKRGIKAGGLPRAEVVAQGAKVVATWALDKVRH